MPAVSLSDFRPPVPEIQGVRPATNPAVITTPTGAQADLASLSVRPGTPEYYAKMPPPAPDGTSRELGGRKIEEVLAELEQVSTPEDLKNVCIENPLAQSVVSGKRVGVYWGPNEKFVLAVEAAPEWDMVASWRLEPQTVLLLLPVLEALGVRVKDVTGGGIEEFRASLQQAPAPARKSNGRRKPAARNTED